MNTEIYCYQDVLRLEILRHEHLQLYIVCELKNSVPLMLW